MLVEVVQWGERRTLNAVPAVPYGTPVTCVSFSTLPLTGAAPSAKVSCELRENREEGLRSCL